MRVRTVTRAGRHLEVREMRLGDSAGIHGCLMHPDFRLPYLTGTPDPRRQPVRPWRRSIDYVLRAVASRRLGHIAFGARRHWLMAITDAASGRFLGAVMLDGVVRFDDGKRHGIAGSAFIEPHKIKRDAGIGDAEWGFFLHPDFWGEGIALQAAYALTAALAGRPSCGAPAWRIVHRICAETGAGNGRAIALLEKAGLVRNAAKTIPASRSPRFEPDGRPIELLHFDQPENHARLNAGSPVTVLLQDMEARRVVAAGWELMA